MPKYNLTSTQQDELISAYSELICDSMDYKSMEQFVYQTLIEDYSNLSHDELLEDIELTMCDVVLEELIDNIGDVAKVQSIFVLSGQLLFFSHPSTQPIHKLSQPMMILLAALLYCVCTQANLMQRLELIMGRNIPDNGTVTDHMMNNFIKREIMPHFEYGTFIDGEGLWKGDLEQTKIFYLECADSEVDEHMLSLNCIAAAYKKQFRQDSVLISQVQTNNAFI